MEFSGRTAVTLLCGRYEGVDERVRARVSEELRTMVTEQMREIQAPQRVEAKGASRSISSFEPEAPALAAPATSIGIPLPAAIASRRKPNFNIVRAV